MLAGPAFALFTISKLGPRALDYPKDRKALPPGLP